MVNVVDLNTLWQHVERYLRIKLLPYDTVKILTNIVNYSLLLEIYVLYSVMERIRSVIRSFLNIVIKIYLSDLESPNFNEERIVVYWS